MNMSGCLVKLLAGLLVVAMLLTFAGCGEPQESESDPQTDVSESESVENNETEAESETEDDGEITFPRDDF